MICRFNNGGVYFQLVQNLGGFNADIAAADNNGPRRFKIFNMVFYSLD